MHDRIQEFAVCSLVCLKVIAKQSFQRVFDYFYLRTMETTEAAGIILVDNPISTLRGIWHAAMSKAKKAAIDLAVWRHNIEVHINALFSDNGGRYDLHNAPHGRMKCCCMTRIKVDDFECVAVIDYLMLFAQMKKTEQEALVLEWMRY